MNIIKTILEGDHLHALSLMLFHSLWQGTFVAVIAGVVIHATRQRPAALRYNLLAILMLAFCVSTAATYYISLAASTPMQNSATLVASVQAQIQDKFRDASVLSQLSEFFRAHSGTVVWMWLMIILARLTVLGFRYHGVRRLKTGICITEGEWKDRFDRLAAHIGIHTPVQLVQSAKASVPFVVGYLRPVVMIPAGMLLSLPPEQTEAILLHELAHIRRRDYLINALQQVVECLFFYHPGINWVCRLIREEREHCCDDLAARHTGNAHVYVEALVSFYEKSLPSQLVLGIGGGYPLLQRVKRLINHHNKTLNFMEKILLTIGLVAAGYFVYALPLSHRKSATPVQHQKIDTSGKDETVIDMVDNGKKMHFEMKNGKIVSMEVDGVAVPPEKFGEFQAEIDRAMEDQRKAEIQSSKAIQQAESAGRDAERVMRNANRAVKSRNSRDYSSTPDKHRIRRDAERARLQALRDLERAERDLAAADDEEFMDHREAARRGLQEAREALKERSMPGKRANADMDENFEELNDLDVNIDDKLEALENMELGQKAMREGLKQAQIQFHKMRQQMVSAGVSEKVIRKAMQEAQQGLQQAQKAMLEINFSQQQNQNSDRKVKKHVKKSAQRRYAD